MAKITVTKEHAIENKNYDKYVGKTIDVNEFRVIGRGKAKKEKAPEGALDLSKATGKELKAYAKENEIELGDAIKVEDIREIVIAWANEESKK